MISENVYKVFCCLFLFLLFVQSSEYHGEALFKQKTVLLMLKRKSQCFYGFFFFFLQSHKIFTCKYTITAYFANVAFPFTVPELSAIMIIKFSLETFRNLENREWTKERVLCCASSFQESTFTMKWFRIVLFLMQKLNGDCPTILLLSTFLINMDIKWNCCHCCPLNANNLYLWFDQFIWKIHNVKSNKA